jgi:hypothetical protein
LQRCRYASAVSTQQSINGQRRAGNMQKDLRTVKKLSEITGVSESFIRHLLQSGALTGYYINSAVLISLNEFEAIAIPKKVITKSTTQI